MQRDDPLQCCALHSPVLTYLFNFFFCSYFSLLHSHFPHESSPAAASLCRRCCCFTAALFMAVSTSCLLRLLLCFLRRAVTFLKASDFKTRPFVCCSVVRCWLCDQNTFSHRNVTSVAWFYNVRRRGTAL